MNRLAALLVAAMMYAGEVRAQSASDRAVSTVAGCYDVALGNWSRSLAGNAAYHQLPRQLRLDTIPAERRGWKIIPDIAYPNPHRFPAPWWITKGDSVEMLWSNGFQPTWIRAARLSNGDLIGEAEVGSDANEYGTDVPKARAILHRVACPMSK